MANTSIVSQIKTYSIPLVLLLLALVFQLFVIPTTYPVSHYDVLGIDRFSSIEKVEEAYEKLSSKLDLGVDGPITNDFVKIRYAFELLTNPMWKRDYDMYGIDEQLHVLERVKGQEGDGSSQVGIPLLDASSSDLTGHAFNVLTTENFQSTIRRTGPLLVQVYSSGSKRSAQFFNNWKRIGTELVALVWLNLVKFSLQHICPRRNPQDNPFSVKVFQPL